MKSVMDDPGRTTVQAIEKVCELAQKCVELAETIRDRQKLKRLEQIAQWCEKVAEKLASDRFSSGAEPDYMADVASMAWELSQASEGRWPAAYVLRVARRQVAEGRQFIDTEETISRRQSIEDRPRQYQRVQLELTELFSEKADPARIVCFDSDFRQWLETLSNVDRFIVESLAAGQTVGEVSGETKINVGVLYRIRSELLREYHYFLKT